MEAFGTVGMKMVYVGMELFCNTVAQQLPPAEQLECPHVFPDDFLDQIVAATHQ